MSATQAGATIIGQVAGGLVKTFQVATAAYDRFKGTPKVQSDLEGALEKMVKKNVSNNTPKAGK